MDSVTEKMLIDSTIKSSDYRIGNSNRAVTEFLFHVTHIEPAVSILSNKEIGTNKILDDPRLANLSGIWLTPNTWQDGSIYGNIRFSLDASAIAGAYKFYWIGLSKWHDGTCNFVISKQSFDSEFYRCYNIQEDEGPLRFRNGILERNTSVNIHIIHDGSLSAEKICEISTIDHHAEMCTLKKTCSKFGKDSAERLLMARCIKDNGEIPNLLKDKEASIRKFSEHLYSIVSHGTNYRLDGNNGKDDKSLALAKEIVDQYSMSMCDADLDKCRELSEKFVTASSARDAIDLYIRKYLGEQYSLPEREEICDFENGLFLL